jgi:hypothetical protein
MIFVDRLKNINLSSTFKKHRSVFKKFFELQFYPKTYKNKLDDLVY